MELDFKERGREGEEKNFRCLIFHASLAPIDMEEKGKGEGIERERSRSTALPYFVASVLRGH